MANSPSRPLDTLHDRPLAEHGADSIPHLAAPHAADDVLDAFGDLVPGKTLGGRYRIESLIGRGATGVVFEGSHLVIGKRVALKCLYPQRAAERNAVERFFREARIAATVEHPHVIQVFDGGHEGGVLFLAMERLEGESLGERLDRGAMAIDEALEVFGRIMDGVAAVHARGVVHRDLKPDNVYLAHQHGRALTPKVLDFGISKLKEPGRDLTALGTVLGTPVYMAPEQIANTRDVDARADVYSLGVMLYEALTGALPYGDDSLVDLFRRSQRGDATPVRALRPEVPPALAQVVEKALRPDPSHRFASVDEMRAALLTARRSDTDPSAPNLAPGDDPRPTVRGAMSPFAYALGAADEPLMDRPTVPPGSPASGTSPISRRTPRWVPWALAVAGVMTVSGWGIALLALVARP